MLLCMKQNGWDCLISHTDHCEAWDLRETEKTTTILVALVLPFHLPAVIASE